MLKRRRQIVAPQHPAERTPHPHSHDSCRAPICHPIARKLLSEEELREIEAAAFATGNAPESYDIASISGSVLRTPCGQGYLNVYPDKLCWHIAGGIIADDLLKPATVEWLKHVSQQHRQTVAVYSVSAEEVSLFREAGYAINKFGEEPILDLDQLDWQGKPFEWVRRQTNYCRRHRLEVHEITCRDEQCALADELISVFVEDLADRVYSHPLRLLEGQFDPRALGRRRLFVARHETTQRIHGFLVINPMENGTAWAFEMYRKRRDAVRGTVPFLFREVADRLKAEGVRQVSLCLVPGKGAEHDRSAAADPRVRWLLQLWYGRLELIFSASGQDFFKSRFRPRYTDRYLCVYPRNSWASIFSFARTTGALRINVWNLLRRLGNCFRGRPQHH